MPLSFINYDSTTCRFLDRNYVLLFASGSTAICRLLVCCIGVGVVLVYGKVSEQYQHSSKSESEFCFADHTRCIAYNKYFCMNIAVHGSVYLARHHSNCNRSERNCTYGIFDDAEVLHSFPSIGNAYN